MRIVIAPDSFKESVTAPDAAAAIARGVRAVLPEAECIEIPMADGGEGFTGAISTALGAELVQVSVHDALQRPVTGAIATATGLAALEVAAAVGLDQIEPQERRVLEASSRGVGELLLAAADLVRPGGRIVIGLGGSATNDGGAGMLAACGVRFLAETGEELDPVPSQLHRVTSIDLTDLDPRLREVEIEVACDVENPLLGASGASAVFGPQKGADPQTVERLDELLARLVEIVERDAPAADARAIARRPGAGAAGGLGWALMSLLDARMVPGVELVADLVGLVDQIRGADLVITGEGSVDAQTLHGKTPAGVASIAQRHGVPCVALAGRVAPDADVLLEHGIGALVPILPGAVDLPRALREGEANLERAAATVLRLVLLGRATS